MLLMFGITMTVIGMLSVAFAAVFLGIYSIFEHREELNGRIAASLIKEIHKKNVPVYGSTHPRGPVHFLRVIKHLSKGVYEYTVDGRKYRISYHAECKHLPNLISVVYLKRYPQIAYIKTSIDASIYLVYALLAGGFAICLLFLGFAIIFM